MIVDKKIVVKLNSLNRIHYRKIGYIIAVDVKEIEVDVLDLPKHSTNKINCKCCNCDKIKKVCYSAYNKQTNFGETGYYCLDCKSVKYKNTMMKNYGVENVSQLDSIKDKKKEKSLVVYGCEYTFQSEVVKEKSSETKIQRYGNKNYRNDEQRELTILNKYGCVNVFQNEDIKEKCRNTKKEKYGDEYYLNFDKNRKTCLERYGVEYYKNIVKGRETKFERYNDENWNNRDKSRETCLQKYGVEYPMQNLDVFNKQLKTSFSKKQFNELTYQGTYELDFLKKYEHLEIS